MRPSAERMLECVKNLDAAWLEAEKCYRPDENGPDGSGIDSEFSVAVRYAHIFLRTVPQLITLQGAVDGKEARHSLARMEMAWRPENPEAAQGDQRGRYDDTLDDADVRNVHLALTGLLKIAGAR